MALVPHHRQPSETIKAAISAAGSRLLVLQTDSADPSWKTTSSGSPRR